MKIVTINVPESYLDAIKKLIGKGGLYPSRSELVRVATREFLLKELKLANSMTKYKEVEIEEFDDENFVRVPTESVNEKSEPIREFKQYKILKRLEYNNSETPKDDVPQPSNHTSPSLDELRKIAPNEPYTKFMNEV